MSNKERLMEAGILGRDTELTPEQDDAIESLSAEDIEHLISTRNKLTDAVDELVLSVGRLTHKREE